MRRFLHMLRLFVCNWREFLRQYHEGLHAPQ